MVTDADCRCENPDTCARCQNEAAEHFAEQAAKELYLGREAGARVMAKIRAERLLDSPLFCQVCGVETDGDGSCPRDCKVLSDDLPDGALA